MITHLWIYIYIYIYIGMRWRLHVLQMNILKVKSDVVKKIQKYTYKNNKILKY